MKPSEFLQSKKWILNAFHHSSQELRDIKELDDNFISKSEHEKLMNNHPMKKERDNLLEIISKEVTNCFNNHISKKEHEKIVKAEPKITQENYVHTKED